jgi:hypothetical protein
MNDKPERIWKYSTDTVESRLSFPVYHSSAFVWPAKGRLMNDKRERIWKYSIDTVESRLSAAQPRQCIFKEKILFSVSITFV